MHGAFVAARGPPSGAKECWSVMRDNARFERLERRIDEVRDIVHDILDAVRRP